MTDPKLKVSAAEDIEGATEVIELPYLQNGKRIAVRVRALDMLALAEAEAQAPSMASDGAGGKITVEESRRLALRFRAVAKAGIVEPVLAFEPGEPGPRYDQLVAGNQAALVMGIYRISGVGQSEDAEAAKSAATFPAKRGRSANGEAAGSDLRAPAATAR
jgi:hypothetical protein